MHSIDPFSIVFVVNPCIHLIADEAVSEKLSDDGFLWNIHAAEASGGALNLMKTILF